MATSGNAQKFNNHTGIALAPDLAQQMIEATKEFRPTSSGNEMGIAEVRIQYAQQSMGVGSLPPPANEHQFQQAQAKAPNAQAMDMFMDKLGARLAFERTGVRLYQDLLSKAQAYGSFSGGPSREDILQIHNEELDHFKMLRQCIEQLGGDPMAMTPAADVQMTAGMGIGKVMADPRTDLVQCLDAILAAELVDNASWESLQSLAHQAGQPQLSEMFGRAINAEQQHLQKVKGWLMAAQQGVLEQRMAA